MKTNKYLRIALYLLIAALVSVNLLTTGTFARYAVTATGTAQARYAAFSVAINNTTAPPSVPADDVPDGEWTEVAILGPPVNFVTSLFDTEYYSPHPWAFASFPPGYTQTKTVVSSNGDKLVAPGIGVSVGPSVNNTYEYPLEGTGRYGMRTIQLWNRSEVVVRCSIRADLDNSSPLLGPIVLFNGDWPLASKPASTIGVVLQPGEKRNFSYGFVWFFDDDYANSSNSGSWFKDIFDGYVEDDPGLFDDARDTAFGKAAAAYLKNPNPTTLEACTFTLALQLNVEQVD